MPDLERMTDRLALHLSKGSPLSHAREQGVIMGKRRARKEVAVVAAIATVIYVALRLLAA